MNGIPVKTRYELARKRVHRAGFYMSSLSKSQSYIVALVFTNAKRQEKNKIIPISCQYSSEKGFCTFDKAAKQKLARRRVLKG